MNPSPKTCQDQGHDPGEGTVVCRRWPSTSLGAVALWGEGEGVDAMAIDTVTDLAPWGAATDGEWAAVGLGDVAAGLDPSSTLWAPLEAVPGETIA